MLKSPPSDSMIEVERLDGIFRGVVEDNEDPLKAGRVRVRVHGIHTSSKIKTELEGIPTDELPWAEPILPINEGSISGFGIWAVPLQGSHVMCFFENGNPTQLRYFGSMPGIPESKESYSNDNRDTMSTDGFKDPNGQYPTRQRLGEPDWHRLSRGKKAGTLVETKNNERDISVPTALGGNWSEPQSPFAARYPHNYVITTHGGLTIELDSTPNAARINIYHPSNSFIEIDNDGNMVVKNNAEKYEIVTEGKNIHIKQQRNLTIDGDSKKKVEGDETIEVGGNKQIQIDGNKIEDIDGDLTQTVGGDKTENISGDKIENITGNKYENIQGDKDRLYEGDEANEVTGDKTDVIGGNLSITVSGNITLTASGNIQLVGSNIGITGAVNVADQATLRRLIDERFLTWYNAHVHTGSTSDGATFTSNPPTPTLSIGGIATSNAKAS
jgi:hypothetical protein